MIYYDMRTNEWVKNLDTGFLAPELYYEIKMSPDEKQYHSFMTRDGVVNFASTNDADFNEQYSKIEDKVLYRKSWSIPRNVYEGGIRYFGLEDNK